MQQIVAFYVYYVNKKSFYDLPKYLHHMVLGVFYMSCDDSEAFVTRFALATDTKHTV